MSIGVLIYLAALAVIYVAERLLDGHATLQLVLAGAGAAGVLAAIVLRVQRMRTTRDEGLRWGHRRMLDFMGVSVVGLVAYAGWARIVEGGSEKLAGILGVTWPSLILIGTVVLVVLDHALQSSPVLIPKRQVQKAMLNALSASFAVAMVFPINYIASRHSERWDFSFFQTAEPGTATRNIVAELPKPIDVRIFQPSSSDVTPEILDFFAQIESDNLNVEVVDQAAVPALARELRVRDNGYIAFTAGEVDTSDKPEDETTDRPQTQLVRIGTELDQARPKLRNLDKEIQKALLQFARGEMTAYYTVGHGEIGWAANEQNPVRSAKGTKQILEYMNFDLEKLGITEGLAEGVPDDADVVLALGPDRGMLPEEVESLKKHLQNGGSLLLAVEPVEARTQRPEFATEDHLDDLLAFLGVELEQGVLAQTNMVVPTANNVSDRLNVATDRFSSHPSTVVLSKNRGRLKLLAPGAGALKETKKGKGKTTVTVRSLSSAWLDKDRNLQMDKAAGESKTSRPIAVAVEGGEGDKAWRALVVSDATLFSDFPIVNPGNQQFIYDGLNWLTGQEALSGEVESEEDVRIQHTREGQAGWFYATVIGIPLLFLGFGAIRLRIRRRGGGA